MTATMAMGDMPAACISKHPMIKDNLDAEEMRQRALLVALGLVYYMRLDSAYRERFVKELHRMPFSVKFLTAFKQEVATSTTIYGNSVVFHFFIDGLLYQ